MARAIICSILGLAFIIPAIANAAMPEEEVIETLTLQPNQEKEITVETSEKIHIGWNHVKSETNAADSCKNNCINISTKKFPSGMASLYGGGMNVEPADGKAIAVLKNLETVPLKIEVYKKKITN